ncbi:hypothetical protein GCM10017581_106240 [Dactylosporangium matsuzakiense]|uniref:Uncharacterized protein n=1 Tax=Dactylosporangium matsuzakiense TaxID=53360 RepID=A0A9W6KWY3_9ACTN|nr:hypothetical protein GCM10017581_106240 [Dactylosporangium matsuzakiense]
MEPTPGTFRTAVHRWLRKLGTALLPWTVSDCHDRDCKKNGSGAETVVPFGVIRAGFVGGEGGP